MLATTRGTKTLGRAIHNCFLPDLFNKPMSIFTPLTKRNSMNPINPKFFSRKSEKMLKGLDTCDLKHVNGNAAVPRLEAWNWALVIPMAAGSLLVRKT
ncbi:hypothetical protein V6N13_013617 [Hibiscus sabdariffa]